MKRRVGMLLAVIILAVVVSRSQTPRLEYVKTIGVSWNPGEWGWMSLVAFSADGSEVASDGVKKPQDPSENLSFWSFPEGRLVRKVVVRARTLSPDWKYYASPQGVGIVGTGKPLITFASERFGISAFSSDSRYVAESSGQQIRVFTLPDGKQVRAFRRHGAFSLAISPDGTTLASGHWDAVALRNLITGTATGMLRGFGRYVVGLSFSNDGAYLAAGTDTGDVQIWDVRHLTRLHSLHVDGGDVSDPAFSSDGQVVAFGVYGTGTVWLVDVRSGRILDHKKVSDLGCGSVAFSPDGRYLITPSTGGIVTWPYDLGGTIRVFKVTAP